MDNHNVPKIGPLLLQLALLPVEIRFAGSTVS